MQSGNIGHGTNDLGLSARKEIKQLYTRGIFYGPILPIAWHRDSLRFTEWAEPQGIKSWAQWLSFHVGSLFAANPEVNL